LARMGRSSWADRWLQAGPNTLGENLFGVSGTAGGAVTTVGALGLVLQLNGTTLTRTPIPAFTKLLTGVATARPTRTTSGKRDVFRSDATGLNPVPGCPARRSGPCRPSVRMRDRRVGWDDLRDRWTERDLVPLFRYALVQRYLCASPTRCGRGASGTLLHGLPINPDAARRAGSSRVGCGRWGGP